RRRLRA
ncbi:hypothetical protein MKD33_17280, partial [Chromobacterium piscinae]